MELGRTIKYYRIKHNMTQAELADGICSIPHLSKIENTIYNANHATASLLLERLGINIEDEYAQHSEIKQALESFIEAIQFVDVKEAKRIQKRLLEKEHIIPRTDFINTYHLYMMRYHLMNGSINLAFEEHLILAKNSSNLSAVEALSFRLFQGILLVNKGELKEAKEILLDLQNEDYSSKYLFVREVAFVLAQCYTQMNEPEKAIIYAKEALHIFKQEDNYIRAFHTHMLLGINYTQMNMVEESLRLYKMLLRNTRLFGHDVLYYQAKYNHGILLKKMGEYEQSHQCFTECISYYEVGSKNYVFSLLADVEVLFHLETKKEHIGIRLKEIIDISSVRGFERMKLQAKYYAFRLESNDAMYDFLEHELLPHLDKQDNKEELIPYALELAQWYQKNGKYEKATEYLSKYVTGGHRREFSIV
ncbi:helix-turn-helix domain-containing protein [Shouchella patagoniensis]|uniref:helix-turn-helix domain-containing protein n=1 Tax=Shouchella patagoniensis TaxID=228576 RepID=UPI000994AEB1|nr:helix-turn-helix transcriptional regulator [Shouchella patagoniensis]